MQCKGNLCEPHRTWRRMAWRGGDGGRQNEVAPIAFTKGPDIAGSYLMLATVKSMQSMIKRSARAPVCANRR